MFMLCACLATTTNADGGFVWTGYERLREPDQKAIIVFDEGVEDLFLKVKFEGKISEFGWIVPLPAKPEVSKITFSCFHLLDMRYNLGEKLYHTPIDIIKAIMASVTGGTFGSGPAVEIISDTEIGDYQVKVLKADNGKSIRNWLKEHNFKIPAGGDKVLDAYIEKHWYFVAIKIKTGSQTKEKEALLKRGELAPLHFSFKTDVPVYPLHISSLNEGITHLKLYLYARELYANKFLIPEERDFVAYKQYFLKFRKLMKGHMMYEEDQPSIEDELAGFYLNEQLPSSLRYEINRPTRGQWYCSRFEKKIPCKEMQDDIIFSNEEKLIKKVVFTKRRIEEKLGDVFENFSTLSKRIKYSYFHLKGFEDSDKYNKIKTVEEFKALAMPPFILPPKLKSFVTKQEMQAKVKKIISVKDRDEDAYGTLEKEEREAQYAVAEKWLKDGRLTPEFFNFLQSFKLYNAYRWYCKNEQEEGQLCSFLYESLSYPRDYDSIPKWLIKPDNSLFKDGYFKGWHLFQANPNFSGWRHVFFTRATPFHRRFLFLGVKYYSSKNEEYSNYDPWDKSRQYQALKLLINYRDPRSFNLLSAWLSDPNPNVRKSALAVMLNSLFNCVAGTSWRGGIRAYICNSAFDNRKINCDKVRPLLTDPDSDCRQYSAWILALLGDGKSKSFFLKTATVASKIIHRQVITESTKELITVKTQIPLRELAKASLIAMANFKDREYKVLIIKLLKEHSLQKNTLINSKYLLIAASAYIADPEIKKLLFNKKNLIKLIPIAEVIREPLLRWIDAEILKTDDPELKLAKIVYSSKNGKFDLKVIKKKIKAILNQTNLTIAMLARIDQLQQEYYRFHAKSSAYYDWRESNNSIMDYNLDVLMPVFWKNKKALLDFTPGALWAWKRLSFGRLDKLSPEKRLSLMKAVLSFQDQALKSGSITRKELIEKCNRYDLLRWAVLSDILNTKRIKIYMSQFKESDSNYKACKMILAEKSLYPENNYDVKNSEKYHDLLAKNEATLKLWTKLYALKCFGEGRKNILLKHLDDPEALAIMLDEFNDKSCSAVDICQNVGNIEILEPKRTEFNKKSSVWLEEYIAIMLEKYYKYFAKIQRSMKDNPGNLSNVRYFFEIIKHDSELLK